LMDTLEQVRNVQTVCERALCFRTKSGYTFEAMLSAIPIEVGEEPCILSALRNITWRKVEWKAGSRLMGKLVSELG